MQSLKGHLLIATPTLPTPIFNRSVILILEHGQEGAVGVILNKPTNTTMTDLSGCIFDEEFEWDQPLYLGGPVQGPLAVLHTSEEMADREVIPGVFQTFDATKVQHVLSHKIEPSIVVANCSGWTPGQLEGEIDHGTWMILPARAEHIFWAGRDDLWKATAREYGKSNLTSFLGIQDMPPDPGLN
jgi:putative transcriptional regulator